MSVNIEELRREKERLEREREDVERRLQAAERQAREQEALTLVDELREFTRRIDALKDERHQLLRRIRETAPLLGDFTYAQDDHRLTLQSARAGLKQPELLDRLLAALDAAGIHVEPRAPRFRLFSALRPVGTLHVASRRIALTVGEPVIDGALIREAAELDAAYPGLAAVERASAKKLRRVREGHPGRLPNGDYATSLTLAASDTGSLDAILPLALRALAEVAAFWARVTPDEEARIFEPWPVEPPADDSSAIEEAPAGEADVA